MPGAVQSDRSHPTLAGVRPPGRAPRPAGEHARECRPLRARRGSAARRRPPASNPDARTADGRRRAAPSVPPLAARTDGAPSAGAATLRRGRLGSRSARCRRPEARRPNRVRRARPCAAGADAAPARAQTAQCGWPHRAHRRRFHPTPATSAVQQPAPFAPGPTPARGSPADLRAPPTALHARASSDQRAGRSTRQAWESSWWFHPEARGEGSQDAPCVAWSPTRARR